MAFHKSNLGSFGDSLPCDMNGYVPEDGDDPWEFAIDHGCQATHDEDGELTDYGEWWEEEGFHDWVASAAEATRASNRGFRGVAGCLIPSPPAFAWHARGGAGHSASWHANRACGSKSSPGMKRRNVCRAWICW